MLVSQKGLKLHLVERQGCLTSCHLATHSGRFVTPSGKVIKFYLFGIHSGNI
jgi:hypothetical protein